MNKKSDPNNNTIAVNRKATFEFAIEDTFIAGLQLEGWEVKSMRAGRAQITDSYVILKDGEAWLLGCQITPLPTVSTHFIPDPTRTRKLLLNHKELKKLLGATQRQGYALVAMSLFWAGRYAKLKIGLGKGKKLYDKRASVKEREQKREQQRGFE
jgi:SsrA-binding protein